MIRGLRIGRSGGDGPGEAAQVLAALRYRRLHRRRARDRIPAYLVVGPPGMGKSELLRRSGLALDRPLELASSSWWIGEDALFVEVVQQEPGPDGGHPVLPLLRALRPAIPVSGIILVLSPADLTLADVAERTEMSAAVSRFLQAFEARFGYAPPLYVVVSKLDLTPGFSEFFDRLEPAEREQPWGFTLPVDLGPGLEAPRPAVAPARPEPEDGTGRGDVGRGASGRGDPEAPRAPEPAGREPGDLAAAYRAGFRRLLDAIRARVTQWISPETDPVQSARIVGFGAQVAALEAILKPIVEPLMPADDRRWAGAWLRGVYLTSTQQDALAIDALLPDMAKRFGLPRTGTMPPDLGRDDETLGYFVAGTVRRVILPEAGLAQRGHRGARRAAIRGWALTAATVVACAGLGLACALSYQDGIARIAGVNEAAAALGPKLSASDPAELPVVLSGLDTLDALRGPGAAAFPPPVLPLDRYAEALIAEGGEGLYGQGLTVSLAPHLNQRLARDLVRTQASDAALRGALAATAGRTDADAYRRWLRGEAEGLAVEAQAPLLRHGEAALRLGAVPGVETAYADYARAVLESRTPAR
ncbi:type VI secretion protein IcmF/TssM N-terminal domain-containing protein [Methylobacterium sp. NEAU 140]|uniref:type VI secretion protein IcmF/TssM N-terminal domain-containing protein n=1 Tax=Methylobacterium sp. NEAU 140 TaxID=3064945 RepID=UPI0027343230|nr:type VI secretion protein IcmF/TssM N-terminal domain-containing protein [Methylobacterium sp. NEAU 140]MDP4025137.1 type VI secretion protein IcmF/TssM N-terminal domain-containing protein [Methylobacterium sp. NEAU 140]